MVLALAVLAMVGRLQAQTPDLSGKYVFAADKSQGTPTVPRIFNTTGAPAGSNELEVTQTPAAVRVKIGGVELVYRTDGTTGNISADGRAGFPFGNATWEGGKLVASLTQEVFSAAKGDYIKVPVKETYSISDGTLTLERQRTHVDGKTDTQKLVYTKSAS
ncbi:MAG: hypothetical protein AB7O32_14005 [Vicinamibacterales bacterium]